MHICIDVNAADLINACALVAVAKWIENEVNTSAVSANAQ